MLCTIASTGRLLREYEERHGEPVRVHTIIVDECGCTPKRGVLGPRGNPLTKSNTHLVLWFRFNLAPVSFAHQD